MYSILFIASLLLIVGLFMVFNISVTEIIGNISEYFAKKNRSIYSLQKAQKRKVRNNPLLALIKDVIDILNETNRSELFATLLVISIIGLSLSIFVSISLNNMLLALPLSATFVMLPFAFIKITSRSYSVFVQQEIETALSVITTSYMRTDDIVSAIKENILYINDPIKSVFERFLLQQRLIHSNVEIAIKNMKPMLKNSVFEEWCDVLCLCQRDRTVKHILPSIVSKMSESRSVNAELDILMYEPVKELVLTILLAIANIPIMYIIQKDWFFVLFNTIPGKVLLTLNVLVCFISIIGFISNNKPIEFKR